MPTAPPRACAQHPTLRLARGVRCPVCSQAYDAQRPAHFRFYTSAAWRVLRARVLIEEPVCVCGARTTEADHVLPRRAYPKLELVRSNIRGLCQACHNRRTAQDRLR